MSEIGRALAILVRIIQVGLALFAIVFVVGSLLGGMNVIAFAAIGILALVLLGFVLVLELTVRPLRSLGTSDPDP